MRNLLTSMLLSFIACSSLASDLPVEMRVGVKVSEPFVIKDGGSYTGISIELWESIYDGKVTYIEYQSVDGLVDAVNSGSVDIGVAPITMTPERETKIDFLHPYFKTGLTYAMLDDLTPIDLFIQIIPTIAYGIFVIFLVMAAAGLIFALIEHRANGDVQSTWTSIFTGIYWSSATITTVGYGDIAAKTPAGRAFSTVWMWAGLIIASMLTGLIMSAVTVGITVKFNIMDDSIVVVDGSASLHYVEDVVNSRNVKTNNTLDGAISEVLLKKSKAIVHDKAILDHMALQYPDIQVSNELLNEDYYAFALPDGSLLIESLNVLILENK